MAQKTIDLGTGYDTQDGQKLRDGGGWINENFTELYKRATLWSAGTYPQRTSIIWADKLYVLSQAAGVPFLSSDIALEITAGAWLELGGVGTEGPQGIPGPIGETGAQGIQGDAGPEGPQGIQGVEGAAGVDGSGVTIQGSDTIANILAIAVPTQGDMWISTTTGVDDDGTAVAIGDGIVYGTNWVTVGPIRGPQGIQGPQGTAGATGDAGATGPQGIQGATGPQGVQGIQGDTGLQGPQGDIGPQGPIGTSGADSVVPGPQGIQGLKGDTGDTGPAGADATGASIYGQIAVVANATSQTIGSTFTKINQFNTLGESQSTILSLANDTIAMPTIGVYTVNIPLSFSGTGNTTFTVSLFLNSVEQSSVQFVRKIGSGGDVGSASLSGQLVTLAPNAVADIRVKADSEGNTFLVEAGTFTIASIGSDGAQGDTGLQGVKGDTGDAGPQGVQGPAGADSTVEGPTGPQGIQGIQGEEGPQGIQGADGAQGIQGLDGPTGPQGEQGIQGIPGVDGTGLTSTFLTNTISFLNNGGDYYGTDTAPRTGTLILDQTAAVDGAISVAYYNNATLDVTGTFKWVFGDFVPNVVNKLYMERDSEGHVYLNITNESETKFVKSDTDQANFGTRFFNIVGCTQAQWDAGTKDDDTYYFIPKVI